MKIIIILLVLNLKPLKINANFQCSNEQPAQVPRYHLMDKCHRSKLGIAAKANYASLTSCLRLGIEKKALALNYSPPDAANYSDPLEYSCEVLKCAEADGGLSLVNDTRFDYYSIYAKPLPTVKATCVPATGMFLLLTTPLNYTAARAQCVNASGALADVSSERRTDALAGVLTGGGVDAALVHMRRRDGGEFVGANGDSLACSTYRAWAPGHPRRQRHQYGCVVLTRHRMWRSVPCNGSYPALCELVPGGPYLVGSIFASRNNDSLVSDTKLTDGDN